MQGPSADNPILCAQFLRGYTDLENLKNIRPEDIEDISERFLPLWQENRDSDSVKRIRLNQVPGTDTLYLIAMIEHQSLGKILSVLLLRINVPKEEAAEFTDRIERRDFTVLFENFEAYDVQETRRISRAEGRAEGKAEDILELLEDIGNVSDELKERIMKEKNLEILRKWHKAAARAENLEQFLEKSEIKNLI